MTESPHSFPGPGPWTFPPATPCHLISLGPHALCRQLPWDPQPRKKWTMRNTIAHFSVWPLLGLQQGSWTEYKLRTHSICSRRVWRAGGKPIPSSGKGSRSQELGGHRIKSLLCHWFLCRLCLNESQGEFGNESLIIRHLTGKKDTCLWPWFSKFPFGVNFHNGKLMV